MALPAFGPALRPARALKVAQNPGCSFRIKVESIRRLRFGWRRRLWLFLGHFLWRDDIDRDHLGRDRTERLHLGKQDHQHQNRQMRDRRCCGPCAYDLPWFHLVDVSICPAATIAAIAAASIPFRRETEIGEPALGAAQPGDLVHLVVGQFKVEDLDIFRQPLDLRGPRDRGYILLYQPAQANLR